MINCPCDPTLVAPTKGVLTSDGQRLLSIYDYHAIPHFNHNAAAYRFFCSVGFLDGSRCYWLVQDVSTNQATANIVHINMKKIELLEQMSDSVHVVARVVRSMALLKDREAAAQEQRKVVAARERYDQALASLSTMQLDPQGKDLVQQLADLSKEVRPLNNRFVEMALAGDENATRFLLDTAGPATTKWQNTIQALKDRQQKKSAADAEATAAAYKTARNLMLGLALVTLTGGAMFSRWVTRSIVIPMARAVDVADGVAGGNLTQRVEVDPKDRSESSSMLRALNDMSDGLNSIVGQVRVGAHTITTSATEIAAGNLDLSARTERQASTLEETAAAMEELTSTVRNNAEHARKASSMAKHTAEVAAHGGTVVGQVVEVMTGIESSSTRIVEIIDVIDSIAFQTNILTLNAAVEAARAGEQGRGFAVVASEVRTLAQRSAGAAHQIKELIHSSVNQIKAGSVLVQDAGTTMQDIVTEIGNVSGLVAEIADATEQQSVAIEQTYQAVSELDTINQQNTALVEEVAATTASLRDDAMALEELVSRFVLQGGLLAGVSTKATRPTERTKLKLVA